MRRITTRSGTRYLIDDEGAEPRFKRLTTNPNQYVDKGLNDRWLPLLPGSVYEEGHSAVFIYGEDYDTQWILSTPVKTIEEVPDETEE
jgi:hypothetical protein